MKLDLFLAASFLFSAATAAAVVFFLLKKAGLLGKARFFATARTALLPALSGTQLPVEQAEAGLSPRPIADDDDTNEAERPPWSSSPYAIDDDVETPEAALTMNLINKKREAKKETIRDVMRRVHRRQNPRQIAETLHVGIGEVDLAMTLLKLMK